MYSEKRFNNHVCVHILINHISNLIIKSKFFEIFREFSSYQTLGKVESRKHSSAISLEIELKSKISFSERTKVKRLKLVGLKTLKTAFVLYCLETKTGYIDSSCLVSGIFPCLILSYLVSGILSCLILSHPVLFYVQ